MINSKLLSKRVQKQLAKVGSQIKIRLYEETLDAKDEIYGESKFKDYSDPYYITAHIKYNPDKQVISELGMDSDTQVIANVSREELLTSGLFEYENDGLQVSRDDIMVIDGDTYDITRVKPTTNYKNPLKFAIGGLKKEGK